MKVTITGGGTGGHIYPGITVAKEIKKVYKDTSIYFIGTKRRIEKEIVEKEGYGFYSIGIKRMPGNRLKYAFWICNFIVALINALVIVKRCHPDVVIGTGGYVCVPTVLAAKVLHIPVVLLEQNIIPGKATRFLSRWADTIAVSFNQTKDYLNSRKDIVITGNPVRERILNPKLKDSENIKRSRVMFGLNPDKFTILVLGGSRGARRINETFVKIKDDLWKFDDLQVLLISGREDSEYFMASSNERFKVIPYIENMENAYAAADLVVCRAGATTIAEITACRLPSILIPYPYAKGNHQYYNAKFLQESGAGKILMESDIDRMSLLDVIVDIKNNPELLKCMSERSRELGKPEATLKVFELIKKTLERKLKFV